MIAYAFRFIDDNDNPTGWHGIAFGQNKDDLFRIIDAHGDPCATEIKVIHGGLFCFMTNKRGEPDFANKKDEPELDCGTAMLLENEGWKRPNWTRRSRAQ